MKIGCLQRIADATEAMAKNHLKMQSDLDYLSRRNKDQNAEIARLCNRIRGLKGSITKLKNKK